MEEEIVDKLKDVNEFSLFGGGKGVWRGMTWWCWKSALETFGLTQPSDHRL